MNGAIVREATAGEVERWDDRVKRFPDWRVFHLRSWVESIEACTRARGVYLICEKSGEPVGCVPGLLVRVGPLRLFCSPREGWQTGSMGPLFDPTRVSSAELVSALVAFLDHEYRIHHIELATRSVDADVMARLGFRGQPLFTYRLPLFPGDEKKTLAAVHARTRTYMRSLSKGNLNVTVESDDSFVDEYYSQTQEVFARHRKAVPFTKARVRELFDRMRASGNLLAIAVRKPDDQQCIATGLFLIGGSELYLWGWAHRDAFGRLHPIELLTWTAMQKAMEAGCVSVDMAGGGRAKMKYGPIADETTTRWIRSRYKWIGDMRHLAARCYRMQQSARGRLTGLIADRRARSSAAPSETPPQ